MQGQVPPKGQLPGSSLVAPKGLGLEPLQETKRRHAGTWLKQPPGITPAEGEGL